MPKEIDKNDVNISTLFKWKTKYSITNEVGEEVAEVYVRIVGDAEMNRARVYALRKSAELRKKLHDKDSDERLAYIPDVQFVDFDTLIESTVLQWTRTFAQEAIKEIKFNLPTEPDSSATLEQQELYQQEVDNWPKKREDMIRKYIEDKLEEKRKEIRNLPKEVIFREYEKLIINNICEDQMLRSFRDMCTYFGSYEDEDCTQKLFSSFEEFENLSSNVKAQLIGAYLSLEIDGEDLKKSLEVTQ